MSRLGLRVCLEEMMQDMQQGQHVLFIAAPPGLPDIVDNHIPDLFQPVLTRQQIVG